MDEEIKLSENMMGTMSENKLLLTISVPMMISMLIQALYNVVDSYFVSKISENALNAVALAFPLQNLMIGVSVGTGVGINSLLSRRLGQKNQKAVNDAAMNGIFLAVLSSLVFVAFGVFFSRMYFESQTKVSEIVEGGTAYLSICTIASFGIFAEITFSRLLQSTGRTMYSMIGQLVGAGTNIILDPIMIFGYLGFPAMGVAGAAVATVAGQILGASVDLFFNLKKNNEIQFKFKGFRPDLQVIRQIYAVGFPAILNTSIVSFMTFGMNRILLGFSTAATAVMGVYFKLQSFIYMPVFGLNNALVPIVAYNYGARKPDRIRKTMLIALMYASGIMLIGILIFQLMPHQILSLFIEKPETFKIGIAALKTISTGFIFSGIILIISAVFQALGHGVYALVVQIIRQLAAVLPLAYLFSLSGDVNMVWWAFPVAEIISALICLAIYRFVVKRQLLML
ncbi:MAG: MATE family efflux transporter [Clostridiales bacterium]|jgi:putative MATE family efflux protein|nr:MATE family efflux transporter [Clostridiales bacterium]